MKTFRRRMVDLKQSQNNKSIDTADRVDARANQSFVVVATASLAPSVCSSDNLQRKHHVVKNYAVLLRFKCLSQQTGE